MFRLVLASFAISLLLCTTSLAQGPCELPDNGNGTVTLPDPDCPYRGIGSFHELLDGLPVGTTVIIEAVHLDFFCDQGNMELCNSAGGSLGGETHDFGSQLELRVIGSGAAEGLDETVLVPVDCVVETGPRAGGPTQIFANSMVSLQGSASGVGSFVSISIEAGSAFGLPSPGQTTLVRDGGPGCDFVVESYFDINYRIDYVGAGLLAGFSGTGEGQVRMSSRALGPDPDEIVQDGPFFDRSIECPTFSPATVGPDTFALYGGPGTRPASGSGWISPTWAAGS
jgi:hypothetical protein